MRGVLLCTARRIGLLCRAAFLHRAGSLSLRRSLPAFRRLRALCSGRLLHRLCAHGHRLYLGAGRVCRRQRAALHQRLELCARQLLTLNQGTGHRVQLLHMLGKNAAGRLVRLVQHIADFAATCSE